MDLAQLQALEARPELATDWQEWYESITRITKERSDEANLEIFRKTHGLSEREAHLVKYYSQIPKSPEHLRYLLTEFLVNRVYDFTEAPYPRDYDDAREVAKLLLGYGNRELGHNSFLYTYPEEVDALAGEMHAERLGLTPEMLQLAAFFAKHWDNRRGYIGTPRHLRRNSWADLTEKSPYYLESKVVD